MAETKAEAWVKRRGELEGEQEWYLGKFRFWLGKALPWIFVIVIIIGIIWFIRSPIRETVGTRIGVALEKSPMIQQLGVSFRGLPMKLETWLKGYSEWKDPAAKKERTLRGIKIESFEPRSGLPFRVGGEVETIADVKVYALDPRDFSTSTISFSCEYEDESTSEITAGVVSGLVKESGRIIVEGIEQNEVYVGNDENKSFNVRCILPGIEIEEEVEKKKVNFYASYKDFSTRSTLWVSVLDEEEFLAREKDGTLLDFLRKNLKYSNLITGDRRAISRYNYGPVKLTLATDRLPLTENRLYSVIISFVPEVSEWAGEINLKQLELSILPDVFEVIKCDLDSAGVWAGNDLEGCNKGCERACDFNVVGVERFYEYDKEKQAMYGRATYDYTIKTTTSVDIRKV